MTYRKCGEIIITLKRNTKNVYGFNCSFCNMICLQLRKFTLHLEKEHDEQLNGDAITLPAEKEEKQVKGEINKISEINIEKQKSKSKIQLEVEEDIRRKRESACIRLNETRTLPSASVEDPLIDTVMRWHPEDIKNILPTNDGDNRIARVRISNMESFSNVVHEDIYDQQSEYENAEIFDDEGNWDSLDTNREPLDMHELIVEKANTTESIVSSKIHKRILIALIDFYKTHPIFWDNKHPDKNNTQLKENILQGFTKSLNENFKSNLKMKAIKRQLSNLVRDYTLELEQQLKCNNGDKQEKALWLYDEMDFLKEQIEGKIQHKRANKRCKLKPLSDEMYGNMLDIYKNYQSLWDVNHLAFTIKEKRQETLSLMVNEVNNKLQLQMDISRLERHIYYLHKIFAREKRNQLICEAKSTTFQTSCAFYDKCFFLQNNQGPFRCTTCQLLIDSYNNYQLHKAKHENGMAFKCSDCGLAFKKIGNYTLHAKRHLRVFKFTCNICGKGYPVTSELDLHMRSHTGAHPYLCSVCGEGFRAAIAYDNHIRRHENRFKYSCHICQRGFNNLTRLNDHVKAHLNVRDVLCGICGKGFTSRKYMNQHKRIHGVKNYACNICGKSFAQDSGLRAHKRNHGTPLSSIRGHKT